jgi:hypothetical protein
MITEPLPWWHPPYPAIAQARVSIADLWDALFGRVETFYRVELDGSWFICEPREVWEWTGTAPSGDVYRITEVRMTRRQFERLPEFGGF